MNQSWESIALKIKAIMAEKGISQKQLADKCGTKQGAISRTLSGKDVNYSTVVNICNVLEINLLDLLN